MAISRLTKSITGYTKVLNQTGVVVESENSQSNRVLDIPAREEESSTAAVSSGNEYRSSSDSLEENQIVDKIVLDVSKESSTKEEESTNLAVSIIADNSNLFIDSAKGGEINLRNLFSLESNNRTVPRITIGENLRTPIQISSTLRRNSRNVPEISTENVFTEDLQLLKKIEVFRGFVKTEKDEIQIKNEIWEILTKELYDQAEGKYLLCRLMPYTDVKTQKGMTLQNLTIGKKATLPIYNEYFIIIPPKNSIVSIEQTAVAAAPSAVESPTLPEQTAVSVTPSVAETPETEENNNIFTSPNREDVVVEKIGEESDYLENEQENIVSNIVLSVEKKITNEQQQEEIMITPKNVAEESVNENRSFSFVVNSRNGK